MKVGVYVGSFNPIHIGHKKIIDYLLDNYLDKIIVIPTLNYWDKCNLIDIKDRINMLKFYENDKIIINDTLNNLDYTYQILNELKKQYKNLYLIIGADNLEKFHLWKNVDEILKHNILVIPRNNIDVNKYINKFRNKLIIVNNFIENPLSSTLIRNKIKNRENLNNYLDKEILNYIKNNNLY